MGDWWRLLRDDGGVEEWKDGRLEGWGSSSEEEGGTVADSQPEVSARLDGWQVPTVWRFPVGS